MKVVIADDHGLMREGLRALLPKTVDVVGLAGDGLEAVRLCQKWRPDIAILDISMPECNGIEAASVIRRYCPTTKILILSMHRDEYYVWRALDTGVSGYMLKDAAGTELVSALDKISMGGIHLSGELDQAGWKDPSSDVEARSPLSCLSTRELQVLQLLAEGIRSQEVADRLNLSAKSVATYRARILSKLKLKSNADLVKFAIRYGITGYQ